LFFAMLKKNSISIRLQPATHLRIGIVAATFNPDLVQTLLDHTVKTLRSKGTRTIEVIRVPGSYEIPLIAMKMAKARKYHVLIALGVVIQGKTSHADHISFASTLNLQRIGIETGIPVIHQILTPRNRRDALARVKIRGIEAAQVAIQMANVVKELDKKAKKS
jgi:6,7-dimethyl-8-ribityllumazine synthase